MTLEKHFAPVSVEAASADESGLIEGLFQFYAYDFSEFATRGNFEFDATGRIPIDPGLDAYWRDPERWPLIIRAGQEVAGFALLNPKSHRGGTVERNMAEFFVARRFRRHGVATAAAHRIFQLHPGDWEVAVAAANTAALAFWPRVIASAPNVSRVVRLEGDGKRWSGPIWSFAAARA